MKLSSPGRVKEEQAFTRCPQLGNHEGVDTDMETEKSNFMEGGKEIV